MLFQRAVTETIEIEGKDETWELVVDHPRRYAVYQDITQRYRYLWMQYRSGTETDDL